ncbi:MAG TPA: hypothetical protein VNS10_08315 [Gemmatimonadaceae bacterium]|nr:hypothetical protein [Gemmatimonadaceae bacterium]
MIQERSPRLPTRTLAQTFESSISEALAAQPIEDSMLRRGVVAFVGEERHAGTSPGRVILTLTKLIEHARVSRAERHALMRRVILWSVEAYFGQPN